MRIGTFRAVGGGYSGQLRTLSLSIELSLVPADPSDSENTPDFRVVAGEDADAREIGAGWKHVGEKAGDYVSLQIDDPSFVQPQPSDALQMRLARPPPNHRIRPFPQAS